MLLSRKWQKRSIAFGARLQKACWRWPSCAPMPRKKLSAEEKKKLFSELDFDKSTLSKLAKIGAHPQLQKESVRQLLPPSYTIVYKVGLLTEGELAQAIEEGVFNPGMTRAELDTWLAQQRGEDADEEKKDRPKVVATVQVPPDYDEARLGALKKALERTVWLQLGSSSRSGNCRVQPMARQMDDYIRKEARRFIATLKSHKLQGAGKLTAAQCERRSQAATMQTLLLATIAGLFRASEKALAWTK